MQVDKVRQGLGLISVSDWDGPSRRFRFHDRSDACPPCGHSVSSRENLVQQMVCCTEPSGNSLQLVEKKTLAGLDWILFWSFGGRR